MADTPRHYPELLADLADRVAAKLAKHGVDAERAAEAGFELAEEMRVNWGKTNMYFPRGAQYEASLRDQQIWRRLGKEKAADLAREFGISEVAVYAAARRARTFYVNERQSQLPGFE